LVADAAGGRAMVLIVRRVCFTGGDAAVLLA